MSVSKKVIPIAAKHIELGIKKYQGQIDARLNNLLRNAGCSYTPYIFNDGRILLVLPNSVGALLYPNETSVYEALALE